MYQNVTPVLQEMTASSVSPAVQVVMLDRTSSAPPIMITTEPELEHNELPLKRRWIRWNVELNGCFCGSVLDSAAAGMIECK